MRTLIRRATLLAMDRERGAEPFTGDLLIDGERIAGIAPDLGEVDGATVLDGCGRLVMPGLVNGHLHSSEMFFKGRYQKLPLELWLLYAYPLLRGPLVPERLLHLRSLLVAMESLKGGVTTICDCFFDPPAHSLDRLGAVFSAYEAAGIRANVASAAMNVPALDALPYARRIVPPELQALLDAGAPVTPSAYAEYCRAAFAAFDGRSGRLRYMVSPSAPQRCTAEFLLACDEVAREHGAPLHTHVLETKTQAVTGPELYGKSLIRHMHDLGILHPGVTIAHAVWVSDGDVALMGAAGCSIVHNAISNQKLGAGVAPVRPLLDAGVNVALGTDGAASSDSLRIFDVMRVAALVHSVAGPDYARWLDAAEVLTAATIGGARSALLEAQTGSLEIGKRADLVILRMTGLNFTPLNDVRNHLVFCENGSSIEAVIVNGETVVRDGKLTRVDEDAILEEVRELAPAYLAEHARIEDRNRILEPYFAEIHRRATLQDIGLDRYAGDQPRWPGQNRPRTA